MQKFKTTKALMGGLLIAVLLIAMMVPAMAAGTDPSKSQWRDVSFPQYAVVTGCKRLNLRSTPSTANDANVKMSVKSGKQLLALGRDGDMIKLQTDEGEIVYGYAAYLYPIGAAPGSTTTSNIIPSNAILPGMIGYPYAGWNDYYSFYNSGVYGSGSAYANNNSIAIGNLQIILQLLNGNSVDLSQVDLNALLQKLMEGQGSTDD